VLAPAFHEKELRVVGSSDGWDYQAHASWYFGLLQRQPTPLDGVFQQTVAYHELPATFAGLARGEMTPVKVFVTYDAGATHE